jgi:DMSO/TMAO reductase YedYZ molybdopterin-dependent catalytic subunit
VFWTDGDNNVWGGVPLWLLVAMVDDDPDAGPAHFNFNDALAAQNYEVNVIAGDGWTATLDSAAIARNDGYIVANTLNGEPLPLQTEGGKDCWPLYLKGSAVFGGQQVGNIKRIELSGLPQPPVGWTLEMIGDVGDTITQAEFEAGLACTGSGHYREWTDIDGNVWSGVPLWVLLGVVDDIETGSHWTFNDALAAGYSVNVVAGDGFTKNFAGADVAGSDGYIVANECNGAPLTDAAPLRLVGAGVVKDDGSLGGRAVGNIARIEIPELQTPAAAPESWNLTLNGKISDVIAQAEFEAGLACPNSGHLAEWTDIDGNVWSGIPLWFLTGWIDDRQPHNYNANQAVAGYTVLVKAGDGYTKDFASTDVAWSNNYIIANKINGVPLTDTSWPLRLVGAGVASAEGALSGTSVRNIAEIELTGFQTALPIPEVHIIKYAEDRTTIIDEMTVNYQWMQSNLDVIGDGTTVYRYEGITNNPADVWDAAETYPGGYKIENAVKGSRVKDLCDLVGGMGAGTEITLIASDGYETTLPYSSIYTDPAVQARQGDAILAWWGDGEYVPYYADGMRLFFTPGGDNVYSQWDMHETLPENYWHYYYSGGIQYPSCAGLSAKLITTIEIYSVPVSDWTLELDGLDLDGMKADISKTYFEQALACQFGANHKQAYTDSQERVWEGMPLWFLVGFVDDLDQHSDNAFNDELALAGYQVVITAADGYSVTVDSADIIRNNDYIVANSLNGAPIPESDSNWPLRLVGPAVTGATSISQIVSIKLVSLPPVYTVSPEADTAYTAGTTQDGINTMTVNAGVTGFKYFAVSITPVIAHSGNETVVFAHFRNGSQLGLNATRADFDQVSIAQAGFNVQPGDVIKAYIVDDLTNAIDFNPTILQ